MHGERACILMSSASAQSSPESFCNGEFKAFIYYTIIISRRACLPLHPCLFASFFLMKDQDPAAGVSRSYSLTTLSLNNALLHTSMTTEPDKH